ncbi:MAG: SET domain-containing protein [Victivallaceae bacterium]
MKIKLSFNNNVLETKELSIERIEKLLNFKFIPSLKYINWKTERKVKKLYAKAYTKGLIDPLALWLGKFHKKDLIGQLMNSLALCWTGPHIGYGVFAKDRIAKWQFIGEYAGILRPRKVFWKDENDYCFRYPLPFISLNHLTIDSEESGNLTRFINHSDNPNAESIGVFHNGIFRVIIRATKDITVGEEITYHYGPLYWKHRKKFPELTPK